MPKVTAITQEIILEAAFQIARSQGFDALSARNIAQQIGCSTQPIYWVYKNMDDLKQEVCQKIQQYLKHGIEAYQKTGDYFLDMGLGYIYMAHAEPILFKAVYMDNILNIQMNDLLPNQEIIKQMQDKKIYPDMSITDLDNYFIQSWMLVHGIASMVATKMWLYDETKIINLLKHTHR